jgi:hypothetical protein
LLLRVLDADPAQISKFGDMAALPSKRAVEWLLPEDNLEL